MKQDKNLSIDKPDKKLNIEREIRCHMGVLQILDYTSQKFACAK